MPRNRIVNSKGTVAVVRLGKTVLVGEIRYEYKVSIKAKYVRPSFPVRRVLNQRLFLLIRVRSDVASCDLPP